MARDMRVIRNVPIVQTGTWQASSGEWVVTRDDIQAAIESVRDPAIRLPRIWIGHDPERATPASEQGGPAVGWMSNLQATRDGDVLLADLHVPPLLAETMHAHFPGRSVEAFTDVTTATGVTHKLVIEGVALLGRELPAVETLEDIAELWGMTPDREQSPPADAPVVAASRRRIVCALGRDTPASTAGSINPRPEATMAEDATTETDAVQADVEVTEAAVETTPGNTDGAADTTAADTTEVAPARPAIPAGFTLLEDGKLDEINGKLALLDDLLAAKSETDAEAYAAELVAAGRIAKASETKIAAEYRKNPDATRAICDLLPEGTHEAPPTGRIAAQRGADEIDLTDPNVPLPAYLQLRPVKKETR
jgi:hypothetical protein